MTNVGEEIANSFKIAVEESHPAFIYDRSIVQLSRDVKYGDYKSTIAMSIAKVDSIQLTKLRNYTIEFEAVWRK